MMSHDPQNDNGSQQKSIDPGTHNQIDPNRNADETKREADSQESLKKIRTVRIHTAMAIITGVLFTASLFVDSLLATGSNKGQPTIPNIDIDGNLPAGSQIARLVAQVNKFISSINTGLQHFTAHVGLAALKFGSHLAVLVTMLAFVFCLYLCCQDYKQREQHNDQRTINPRQASRQTPIQPPQTQVTTHGTNSSHGKTTNTVIAI